jgi:multidrug resistance efflux pump
MVVKVKRERADQRRHHRVTAPLHVEIAGHRVRAADWSLGGLRIIDFPGALPEVGQDLPLQLALPFQGFDVSFNAKGLIVRVDPASRMFALRFSEIGERERELMQHFIEELVRGSMIDIEDTIQRIDVPVTPASLEPDPNPVAKVPVRRMPVKTIAMTGVYALLGVVVFGYTALIGYTNFYRLEVQTAVISAPVETVQAQADGKIEYAEKKPGELVRPGDAVNAGQIIVNVFDNVLEREIELADITIREQKAKLLFLKRRQSDELDKLKGFATIDSKNLQQSRLELDNLSAQLQFAHNQLERLSALHGKGFATDSKLEEAQKQVLTLTKAYETRRLDLTTQTEIADGNFGKRYFNGNAMVGDLAQLEAQVRLAEQEIQLALQKQTALFNHRRNLSVRAPFDGTVLELPRVNNGHIRRGDTIALIEQRKRREITAFMTQDEILKIGLDDVTKVFVPSLQETLKARVVRIDRTSGFVREQEQRQAPGYSWRSATDRSARVTLAFEDDTKLNDQDRYRAGLPVVVIFPQRTTNSLISALRSKISLAL